MKKQPKMKARESKTEHLRSHSQDNLLLCEIRLKINSSSPQTELLLEKRQFSIYLFDTDK